MKKFLSVDGVIRGEVREGEAPRQFVLDAMGSIVEVYQAGALKADASYAADGDMLSASWNMSSYSFRWLGGWGYRYTGKDWVNTYVRARHYSTSDGGWGSVDPLWPDEAAYRYVEGRVKGAVDPSGLWSFSFEKSCTKGQVARIRDRIARYLDPHKLQGFFDCLSDNILLCANEVPGKIGTPTMSDPGHVLDTWSGKPPGAVDFTFKCGQDIHVATKGGKPYYNCGKATKAPATVHLNFPIAYGPPCGPLHCLIVHELIHLAAGGLGHSAKNDQLWQKCMPLIEGCEKYDQ